MAVACPCLPTSNGSIHTCSLCHCTKLRVCLLPATRQLVVAATKAAHMFSCILLASAKCFVGR